MRTYVMKPERAKKSTSQSTWDTTRPHPGNRLRARSPLPSQPNFADQPVRRSPVVQEEQFEFNPAPPAPTPLESDIKRILLRPQTNTVVHAGIGPELMVGSPDDRCEQEADHLADQVMSLPTYPSGTSLSSEAGMIQHRLKVHHPAQDRSRTASIQAPTIEPFAGSTIIRKVLSAPGQMMASDTLKFMQARFKFDFGHVRVHSDAKAAEAARVLQARAFTVGNNIVFGFNEYQPYSTKGKRLLCHELAHVIQQQHADNSNVLIIQRTPITFRRGTTITADPVQARRTFARIRESVQNYCDNSLDYFSNQYLSAMTSFRIWYNRQPRADASFFNSVVNVIMNTTWAWGGPVVGAVAAPVGSIIQLIAQQAAGCIQNSRNEFADSLISSANNFQAGIQRSLSGRVPELIERRDPALWEEIQRRAYFGEEWQSLLHERAGLPRRGTNYQTRLLSSLIFEYRRWELSQHSAMYRGIYSMADPYLSHMRGRAEAEAYIQSGLPIPRHLSQYAHPGEITEE